MDSHVQKTPSIADAEKEYNNWLNKLAEAKKKGYPTFEAEGKIQTILSYLKERGKPKHAGGFIRIKKCAFFNASNGCFKGDYCIGYHCREEHPSEPTFQGTCPTNPPSAPKMNPETWPGLPRKKAWADIDEEEYSEVIEESKRFEEERRKKEEEEEQRIREESKRLEEERKKRIEEEEKECKKKEAFSKGIRLVADLFPPSVYRKLILEHHPDKHPGADNEIQSEIAKGINTAFAAVKKALMEVEISIAAAAQ
jgi:hypothetical protein